MSPIKIVLALFLGSLTLVALPRARAHRHLLEACGFDAIYQLGDSISDTGNSIWLDPSTVCARPPYGETFFKKPTGRCSNGLLVIDYVARSAGLPFLDAYLNPKANFSRGRGVNFAVVGSTALPVPVLAEKKILAPVTNSSLSIQLDWMFTHFNSICYNDQDCAEKLKSALFMVGEIGGNDYNYALLQGRSMEEVKAMVPEVLHAIKGAVKRVIGYGARQIVVPGNFPIGCLPIYLTTFRTNDTSAYDKFHCLKGLNYLSAYHNQGLRQVLEELRERYNNVTIVYGDYYLTFKRILGNVPGYGLGGRYLQKACCGTGGDYDFSLDKMCGAPGVPVCPDPDQRTSWDGIHPTQRAYKYIAKLLIAKIWREFKCYIS